MYFCKFPGGSESSVPLIRRDLKTSTVTTKAAINERPRHVDVHADGEAT